VDERSRLQRSGDRCSSGRP